MKLNRICIGVIEGSRTVDFAVDELRKYLLRMDKDLLLDILRADKVEDDYGQVLWVGLDKSFEKYLPKVENPQFDDAVVISVKDNRGFITGTNERSVLFGVYRVLSELGCRWTRPGVEGERIPKRRIEKINIDITETPSYRHRAVCIEGVSSYQNVYDMVDFLPKKYMNAYFMQTFPPEMYLNFWYSHDFNPYIDKDDYEKKDLTGMIKSIENEIKIRGLINQRGGHGWTWEAFGEGMASHGEKSMEVLDDELKLMVAEVDGKRGLFANSSTTTNLCYSNKKARDKMNEAIVKFCKNNPQTSIVHLWLADMPNNHCECEECIKKTPSDWYVILLNELDEKLTEAGLDTKIVFLLYYELIWAPEKEVIKNDDRFILMFAPATREYGKRYSDFLNFDKEVTGFVRNNIEMSPDLAENIQHLRNWQKNFSGDSFAFEYHIIGARGGDLGHEKCAKNVHDDIKDLKKIGLNGYIDVQQQRAFFPSALPVDILSKTLWNTECDFEKEVEEYYLAAYGKDGPAVHKYLSTLSGLTLMYDRPAYGDTSDPYGPFCKDYTALAEAVEEVKKVIKDNLEKGDVYDEEWKLLDYHTYFITELAKVMQLREQRKDTEALEVFEKLTENVLKNEVFLIKVYDTASSHNGYRHRFFKKIEFAGNDM